MPITVDVAVAATTQPPTTTTSIDLRSWFETLDAAQATLLLRQRYRWFVDAGNDASEALFHAVSLDTVVR